MPKFTYTGQTKTGEKVKKVVSAKDRFEVYDIARTAGHVVDTVDAARSFGSATGFFDKEKLEAFISRVKADELVMATRNLGAMLVAGLPLTRGLSVIERQTRNPRLRIVMKDIRERVNKGNQFHEALAEHKKEFSDLYIAMVRAGEESGKLSEALQTLSLQMERSSSLKKKIKGAMIYPAIVVTVLVIIGILMMMYVMPSITETFESLEVELPTTTKILIAISKAFQNHTILVFGVMGGSIVGTIQFLRTKYGKVTLSWVIPRLPIIGPIAKEANAASTARTLSSLLSAGVDIVRSLNITEEVVQNVYYKAILAEAAKRVEKGGPLSEVFTENEKLYPVLVGEMVLVGEETGQISNMLQELAVFYENEVEQKTKDLSTIIEPILMVVIGGTVGFFALSVIAPIYSISDSIG